MSPEAKAAVPTEVSTATPVAPVPATPTTAAPAKKFVLAACDSIEDLAIEFAKTMLQAGLFTVKDNKSGNGNKYAIWTLDDGLAAGPYSQGLGLNEEQARRLPTKDGVPAILSFDVVMRQLTPISGVKAKLAERQAATANRESNLLSQLNAIRRKNGQPEIS